MLIIHPPVAKPSEPPAGIAKLSGALASSGIRHSVLDANIEGLSFLLRQRQVRFDTWTTRAHRHLPKNLGSLRTMEGYLNFSRYARAVRDVNRVLEMSAAEYGATVGLANYRHRHLSPLRSEDLLQAAERPEDDPFYPYFSGRLRETIEADGSGLVGFSITYLSQALSAFAMIGFVKREFPGVTIILGGGLMTSWVRTGLGGHLFRGLADRIIAGPGEHELLSLHTAAKDKTRHFTPEYDQLPVHDYLAPGTILPYSASSGCSWHRCSFCPERAEANPYVPVPAARVTADLAALTASLKPSLVHMLDNSLSTEVMKALIHDPPGPPWYGFARVTEELADQDFCKALKKSGCVMLKLGLESGDQGVLDAMKKGIDLRTASGSLQALKKAGIATYVYLIFGTPAETPQAARGTLDFTVSHIAAVDFLNLAIFNMPAHGDEARLMGTRQFYEGDLSLYTDFVHPKGWNRKDVRQFLESEFKRHPAVASVVNREPPLFTSNHAPFFVMQGRK
ncbi:MAG: B12-binding domain-containing radical SAM protein [Chloroflexota bacterium]